MAEPPGYGAVLHRTTGSALSHSDGYDSLVADLGTRASFPAPVTDVGDRSGGGGGGLTPGEGGTIPVRPLPPARRGSTYDDAVQPVNEPIPGSQAATDYGRPAAADASVGEPSAAPGQTPSPAGPADQGGADRPERAGSDGDTASVADISKLVGTLVDLQKRASSRRASEPNEALARTQQLMESGQQEVRRRLTTSPADMGPLADVLDEQTSRVLARTKVNNLAVAYLEGVLLQVASAVEHAAAGAASTFVDPVGTAVAARLALLRSMQEHMADGESFWEAVNSTVNPMVSVLEGAWTANEVAGQAITAAQAGHWDLAVALARQSGRGAGAAGMTTGFTALGSVLSLRRAVLFTKTRGRVPWPPTAKNPPPAPRPPALPPPPQRGARTHSAGRAEPDPEPAQPFHSEMDRIPVTNGGVVQRGGPGGDWVTGTVMHDGATGPQLPTPAWGGRPHPVYPGITSYDRPALELSRDLHETQLLGARARAELRMRALTPAQRRVAGQRLVAAGPARRLKEQLSALDMALQHPDAAVVTQVHIFGVQTPKEGFVPIAKIARNAGLPARTATIPDSGLIKGRTVALGENKELSAILRAYGYDMRTWTFDDATVEVKDFTPGELRNQQRLREEVIRFARDNNGIVNASVQTLEGETVPLFVHGRDLRDPRITGYRDDPNQ